MYLVNLKIVKNFDDGVKRKKITCHKLVLNSIFLLLYGAISLRNVEGYTHVLIIELYLNLQPYYFKRQLQIQRQKNFSQSDSFYIHSLFSSFSGG
jgi:hypothetical protein